METPFSAEVSMGIDLVQPLQSRPGPARRLHFDRIARAKRRLNLNAYVAMGLWTLLWMGYNTSWWYLADPNFPANTPDLIHCVRAFFPMLAGWLAVLIIMVRSSRVLPWVAGPLGLMLVYAVTGLVATVVYLGDPLDGLYYGTNYLAMILVLLAIVPVENPLADLRRVLNLTWIIGSLMTIGLLGAIPFLSQDQTMAQGGGALHMRAYTTVDNIMGMTGTRNTGFARYAAMSALVTLPWLWRKSNRSFRVICAAVFLASMYALVIANGRTEILGFMISALIILLAEKSKRTAFLLMGAGAAVLLALDGFYHGFFVYFTRTGHVDASLTGRTGTWEEAWRFLGNSPVVGLGFQSDRVYLHTHMHDAFLHVLFQAGIVGGGAMIIALAMVWYYIIKYFFVNKPADKSLIPPEIPAIFLFVTISSITESTFAYFSAAWLLSAPIVPYVMALDRHMRRLAFDAYRERTAKVRLAKFYSKNLGPPLDVSPSPPDGETEVEREPKADVSA